MNIFFCHIHKTGGTSIQHMIQEALPDYTHYHIVPIFSEWKFEQPEKCIFSGHAYYELANILPDPLYTFTMLRNPVDRMVSFYKHVVRDGVEKRPDMEDLINMSPSEAVHHPFFKTNGHVESLGTVDTGVFHHMLEAVNEYGEYDDEYTTYMRSLVIHNTLDEKLLIAKNTLNHIDFGLFECYDQSLRIIFDKMGIELHETVKENAAPADQDHPFSEADLQVIRENQRYDMELYQYGVELYRKRLWTHNRLKHFTRAAKDSD